MQVESFNFAPLAHEGSFYESVSLPGDGAQVCRTLYPDQTHVWGPQMHPFHASMNWTHYTDAQTQGAKACVMSAHSYAIARRNERERNRVRHINSTFERLRKHLPPTGRKRKLSKVDTLRTAIQYIEHLQDVLDQTTDHTSEKNALNNVTVWSANTTVKSEQNNNNKLLSPSDQKPGKLLSPNNSQPDKALSPSSPRDGSSMDSFLSCRFSDNSLSDTDYCKKSAYLSSSQSSAYLSANQNCAYLSDNQSETMSSAHFNVIRRTSSDFTKRSEISGRRDESCLSEAVY